MNIEVPTTPFFLAASYGENRGVDFLGLRQANLDMMSEMIPSINNVTWYIRPFSVLSWVYWKFQELCADAGIEKVSGDDLRKFRERIEVLFTWGASLQETTDRVPGTQAIVPPATNGTRPLTFAAWGRVQNSTSLIAALWYGPASKTVTGLGFLSPVPGRTSFFKVGGAGLALAQALDECLRKDQERYTRLLATLDPVEANEEDANALWELWSPKSVSEAERSAFALALVTLEELGSERTLLERRSNTFALAKHHLAQHAVPLSVEDIRMGMCFSALSNGERYPLPKELEDTRSKWLTLQMRQLQRLALESLLRWCEDQIINFGIVDPSQMASDFSTSWVAKANGFKRDGSLFELLSELDENCSTIDGFIDAVSKGALPNPFSLMNAIIEKSTRRDTKFAETCFVAILLCAAFAGTKDKPRSMVDFGDASRLSLSVLRRRLNGLASATVAESFEYILEAMVISQHFATAVNRFDGRAQRLRLAIEETGLTALVPSPWEPTVTQDRLATLLSLAAQSELVGMTSEREYYALP